MATGDPVSAPPAAELSLADAMAYARELQLQGRLEAADELYGRIVALAPAYADAWHFRGVVVALLGRMAEAETLIRKAVELVPDYPDAHNNLGNVLQQQGRIAEAADSYERALVLNPELADAHNNLGNTLTLQRRYEDAVVRYQRAVELRPDMADARVNLAKAYEALNRTGEALTEYRQAVMLRPYHFDTYRRLGALLYGSNRLDEAADVYRRWLSLDPGSPVARHLIAACTGQDVPARASDDTVRTMFQVLRGELRRGPGTNPVPRAGPGGAGRGGGDGAAGGATRHSRRPGAGRACAASTSSRSPVAWSASICRPRCSRRQRRESSNELIVGELTVFVGLIVAAWDVIISADTLVYFGDLAPVIAAARRGLRPGGHLVFTLEHAGDAEAPAGFRINPHGRYSHTEAYVRAALGAAELEPRQVTRVHLRLEFSKPVDGLLVVAAG